MEPFETDKLVAALESLRPAPRPDFAAELDQRAAAGFTRHSRLGRLTERLRAIEPRRALIPAGATALAAVAAVTVVVAIGTDDLNHAPPVHPDSAPPSASDRSEAALPAPPAGVGSGAVPEYATEVPNVNGASSAAESASGASSAAETAAPAGRTGPYAAQAPRRKIERSAQLVLGTDPANVRKASAEVFDTVHAYRGIVLDSSIRDGAEGDAGARFALLIPSAKLGDAMADFSAIGEVRSRREATTDITAPTVRTGEQLRDSRAKIEGLLAQLASADTDAERTATEAELRAERRHSAYLRSQLSNLERRANLSRVSLRIETGEADASSGGSSSWGIGEALGEAGRILSIAAGVTIIGLAVVGPIALIALLAWLANRARVRRGRQRALA